MNGFLLLLPFFAVRFGLLAVLDQGGCAPSGSFRSHERRRTGGLWHLSACHGVCGALSPLPNSTPRGDLAFCDRGAVRCGWAGLVHCIHELLCPTGFRWIVYRRGLPLVPKSYVSGIFSLFYRLCPDDRFGGIDVRGAGVSSFCTLDHSGRRTLVPANFWRTLPRLYEEGAAIHIEKIL